MKIETILRSRLLKIPDKFGRPYRVAAVVVPIVEDEILLTRRADTLHSFSGQIAFPGGRPESGETPLETALREFEEETGIPANKLNILGALREEKTRLSDFIIYPVVALLNPPFELHPDPAEVADVFTIPLASLKSCERYHPLLWSIFQCGDRIIWGATYRIIKKLLGVLDEQIPDRKGPENSE